MGRGRAAGSSGRRAVVLAGVVTAVAVGAWALTIRGDDGAPRDVGRDDGPSAQTTPATFASGPQLAAALAAAEGGAPVVSRIPTTDRVVFLGIDDGLVRDPAALDYLARKAIPYTSFLVTGALEVDPGFWARSRATGGTIQAHTMDHANLTEIAVGQMRRELCGAADEIERVTGSRPTLLRPPYGAYDATVRAVAHECGYAAIVMWMGTVNGDRVDLQEHVLAPGDILLLHWRDDLLPGLKAVVARARAEGFTIARLEDYLLPLP